MKKKIVLIIFLPKFVISGAGNSVFQMINGLDKKKFIIYVICFDKCEYAQNLRRKVKLFELNYRRLIFASFKIIKIVKNIYHKHLNKKIIFMSNHHYANIFSLIIKLKFKKIKIIGVERTAIHELKIFYSFNDFVKKKILLFLVKNFYKYFDKIVSNSKYVQKEINQFSKKNSITIYPPSVKKNYTLQVYKKHKNKNLNILMVGRLDKEKGIDTAIKALELLNFKYDIKIVGRGTENKKLQSLVKKNKVQFLGHKNNLKKYYAEADLFLNTSHFEGFSNAIIEALNYKVPVIAANCPGGNNEILGSGKFGQLFRTNDYLNLYNKIEKFNKNRKLFNEKALLAKKSINRYTFAKNITQYTQLFEKI